MRRRAGGPSGAFRSAPRFVAGARAAVLGSACVSLACDGGRADPCAQLGQLCRDATRSQDPATRVSDAVSVDLDGDGVEEIVALSAATRQLVVGSGGSDWRSLYFFDHDESPVALARLPGEVAIALTAPPGLAIFGVDAAGRLQRRRDLELSAAPRALWSGDLDGDGRTRLVVAHDTAGEVSVIDPVAATVRPLAVGGHPHALAVADLDGDARPDIVALDGTSGSVTLLRGAGNGEFHGARGYAASRDARFLALADHDGDGDIDVLTRGDRWPGASVLRNDGTGALSAPFEISVVHVESTTIEVAGLVAGPSAHGGLVGVSVPQDALLGTWVGKGANWLGRVNLGLPDVATWIGAGTDEGSMVGGAGFVGRLEHGAVTAPIDIWRDASSQIFHSSLAIGDLDGAAPLDFAVRDGRTLRIYLGDAELGFRRVADLELEIWAEEIAIADITGDGRGDVALTGDGKLVLAYWQDDGEFAVGPAYPRSPAPQLTSLRTGANAPAVLVAYPHDIYYGSGSNGSGATVLRFDGDGQLTSEVALADSLRIHRVVAVDFDEDGADEPLLFATRDDRLLLTRWVPAGTSFVPGPEHDLAALSGLDPAKFYGYRFAAADLDGDRALDVMVDISGGALQVSGLEDDAPSATLWPEMTVPHQFHDIDRDGHPDAVDFFPDEVTYRRGRGDGSFDAHIHRHTFPEDTDLALVSGMNAQFDAVSASRLGAAAHLFREVVLPTASEDAFVAFHGPATDLVTGDLDRDGHADVVVTCGRSGAVVLWGDPTGALARADGVIGRESDYRPALADLDGDDFLEVLTANSVELSSAYRFWPRRERIELDKDLWYTDYSGFAVADVDGDGLQDLLTLAFVEGSRWIEVAYGTGPARFESSIDLARLSEPGADGPELGDLDGDGRNDVQVAVGDLDGDGRLDVLVASQRWGVLVRNEGARVWGPALRLSGQQTMFGPADPAGRVELWVHDDTALVRHASGAAELAATVHPQAVLRLVADIDADGRTDFVLADETGAQQVWFARGGGWQPVFTVDPAEMFVRAAADIDGDGRPDLVGLAEGRVVVRRAAADD